MSFDRTISKRAQKKVEQLRRARQTPRFKRVIGRLGSAGLLVSNVPIEPFKGVISLNDWLWAGTLEPRILELLPALLIKRPSYFSGIDHCPDDLQIILKEIRRGQAERDFRGIPARNYMSWLPRVGQRGKQPTLLKSFRFRQEDITRLETLKLKGYREIEVIRMGLALVEQALASTSQSV